MEFSVMFPLSLHFVSDVSPIVNILIFVHYHLNVWGQ